MNADGSRHEPHEDFDELCAVLGGLLLRTLPELFQIEKADAEKIVYDAFVGWITSKPADSLASEWITTVAYSRASAHQKAQRAPLSPGLEELDFPRSPEKRMKALSDRERTALHLALIEKKSYREIAAEMDVAVVYARKLVRGAAAKLRKHVKGR